MREGRLPRELSDGRRGDGAGSPARRGIIMCFILNRLKGTGAITGPFDRLKRGSSLTDDSRLGMLPAAGLADVRLVRVGLVIEGGEPLHPAPRFAAVEFDPRVVGPRLLRSVVDVGGRRELVRVKLQPTLPLAFAFVCQDSSLAPATPPPASCNPRPRATSGRTRRWFCGRLPPPSTSRPCGSASGCS